MPASVMAASDKSKPYLPLAGLANDGWSTDDQATATCFCGTVQLSFVSRFPDFLGIERHRHLEDVSVNLILSDTPLSANSRPWHG